MAKVTFSDIGSIQTAATTLNNNFATLETELQSKVLYRDNPDGEPNQMENDLDLNSHALLNVATINGLEIVESEFLPALLTAIKNLSTDGIIIKTGAETVIADPVLDISYGGTGLNATGAAGTFLAVDSIGTALEWKNILEANHGGTGFASYTTGDLLYADSSTTLAKLGVGAANRLFGMNNAGTLPEYKSFTYVNSNGDITSESLTATSGTGVYKFGLNSGATVAGNALVTLGLSTGRYLTTLTDDVIIGNNAGVNGTSLTLSTIVGSEAAGSGSLNVAGLTAVGYRAGYSVTTSQASIFGAYAGDAVTTAAGFTAFGYSAGSAITTQVGITAIGSQALELGAATSATAVGRLAGNNTAGTSLVFIGNSAGRYGVSGTSIVAIGSQALEGAVSQGAPSYTTVVGAQAAQAVFGGSYSTIVGYASAQNSTSISYDVMLGANVAPNSSGTANNTLLGAQVASAMTNASGNLIAGYNAGASITSGTNNVILGINAGPTTNQSNQLYIHNSASNTPLIFGNFSSRAATIYGNLSLANSSDLTKIAAFATSNITTGTTRTFSFPDATGTFVLDTSTQTLTNKTLALGSNTVSGTTAQFNTALTDGDFATLAGSETLTNKTLTSPVINTPTIIVNDNVFTMRDNTDTTKQAQFELSGLTTATTRTYTLPDSNGTLAIVGTDTTDSPRNSDLGSGAYNSVEQICAQANASGIGNSYIALTATTYTVTNTDTHITVNAGATCTLTLPDPTLNNGRVLRIRTIAAFTVVSATSNVVPNAGGAAGTAILAAVAGRWAELVSDGTNWQIMMAN